MMNETNVLNDKATNRPEINLEQLQAVLFRYCLSLTRSRWDAEDLAQDTWLKGLRAAIHVSHKNPEALLLRIAKNTWIDQLRRHNKYQLLMQQESCREPEVHSSSLDNEEALYSLMRHLSPLQRTVFLLRDVLDYSIEETAVQLNTTTGAIKAALHRAREALQVVKRELNEDVSSPPVDEDMTNLLRAMAHAYQSGNLELLIELAMRDITEAAIISSIAHHRKPNVSRQYKHSNHSLMMQWAA